MSASCSNEAEHSQNIVPWWMFSGAWPCFFLNEKKSFLVINMQNKLSKNKGKITKDKWKNVFLRSFKYLKRSGTRLPGKSFVHAPVFSLFLPFSTYYMPADCFQNMCTCSALLKPYNSLNGITLAQWKIMKQIASGLWFDPFCCLMSTFFLHTKRNYE